MTIEAAIAAALEGVPAHAHPHLLRVILHLSQTDDPTLLVLRGHLLLEELINAAIAASVRDSRHLTSARLSYAQSLALLKAIVGVHPADRSWAFLTRLGVLRNALSHRLEVPALERDMDALIAIVAPAPKGAIVKGQERTYRFTLAVAFVAGRLTSLLAPATSQPAT